MNEGLMYSYIWSITTVIKPSWLDLLLAICAQRVTGYSKLRGLTQFQETIFTTDFSKRDFSKLAKLHPRTCMTDATVLKCPNWNELRIDLTTLFRAEAVSGRKCNYW